MAILTPVRAVPILGIEDGYIVLAATVTAHVKQLGKFYFQVAEWRAGEGTEVRWLEPADFESWRRMFQIPSVAN